MRENQHRRKEVSNSNNLEELAGTACADVGVESVQILVFIAYVYSWAQSGPPVRWVQLDYVNITGNLSEMDSLELRGPKP